jgi:hypothetical protein
LWHATHLLTSNLTVVFTLLHFALHWQWMAGVARRMISPPSPIAARIPAPARASSPAAPHAPAAATLDRR